MAKVYDIVARVGEYEGKGKFKNVGLVNKNDKGHLSIRLDHPITIDDDGNVVQWYSLFEPREREEKPKEEEKDILNFIRGSLRVVSCKGKDNN
jgi:hypothetical protein